LITCVSGPTLSKRPNSLAELGRSAAADTAYARHRHRLPAPGGSRRFRPGRGPV